MNATFDSFSDALRMLCGWGCSNSAAIARDLMLSGGAQF